MIIGALPLAAGVLRVKNADRFMTVAAISLDGKPLAGSGDILIIHLTNLSGSNVPYAANDICNSWGTLPLLVERGTAELELAGSAPWRVAALATDGSEKCARQYAAQPCEALATV